MCTFITTRFKCYHISNHRRDPDRRCITFRLDRYRNCGVVEWEEEEEYLDEWCGECRWKYEDEEERGGEGESDKAEGGGGSRDGGIGR
jgi:hypothetical protein